MNAPAILAWFAAHELRLAWRDWRDMLTAGGRRSLVRALSALAAVAAVFHLPVWVLVDVFDIGTAGPDAASLATAGVILVLFGSLLTAQAMESVTRSLYSRGDLDLIVSSPVALTRLFAVRLLANAAPIVVLALALAAPLANVLMATGGPRWLAVYGVAASLGIAAAAIAVMATIGLFRLLGPRRTRLVAQVVAAVVGAAFAIGIQVMAIASYGSLSGGRLLMSPEFTARLPGPDSLVWLPARAAFGDVAALVAVAALTLALMLAVVVAVAPRLADDSLAATAVAATPTARAASRRRGAAASPMRALRRKEWALLRRDPWLVSQTLTQLFYLIPPALLLTQSLGGSVGAMLVIVMVLVTVAGQLAGALAWLAVSGEDAPDLVATAPVPAATVTRAKVESVVLAVALALGPLLAILAAVSPAHAAVAGIGAVFAALSTIRIQLWFRAQAQRSHFRRRHTSSRIATFAEAMVSFSWAAAAGLAADGNWLAGFSVLIALLILAGARSVSPRLAPA